MGGRELVAADESAIVTKLVLDSRVVEDLQCDRRLPNPPCTDESDRLEVFSETDDGLDEFVASETCPGWWGR